MEQKGVAVIAVGGNSLIKDETHRSVNDQYEAGRESMHHIADMIADGWKVVISHGNGPQVGFIYRRSELSLHELHPVPMDFCGADTQGAIGYMFTRALYNEFLQRGISKKAVAIVTQTVVDRNDPGFQNPMYKPAIGLLKTLHPAPISDNNRMRLRHRLSLGMSRASKKNHRTWAHVLKTAPALPARAPPG